jgi:omega-hydroxy-beta-dihydromenaquinone-9 sulfotransferase
MPTPRGSKKKETTAMFLHRRTLLELVRIIASSEKHPLRFRLSAGMVLLALMLLRGIVAFGRFLDRFLFPAYTSQTIPSPIYIIASPRSGTTLLHRLLCLDPQFTCLRLYHSLLPAVSLIRFVDALGRLDGRFGGVLGRVIDRLDRNGFKGWRGIHSTGLTEPEEDEQLFLFTLLSPSLLMFFPLPERLSYVAFVDRLPSTVRRRLSFYYRDSLLRILYAQGTSQRLLAKNVLIHGRLRSVLEVFPTMRIIHLVRHPYETIPSFLSMYARVWKQHSPDLTGDAGLSPILCDYYKLFLEIRREIPQDRLIEIPYEALAQDLEGTVRKIYSKFALPLSPDYLARLRAECNSARGFSSTHRYSLEDFGLTRDGIHEALREVFETYGFER